MNCKIFKIEILYKKCNNSSISIRQHRGANSSCAIPRLNITKLAAGLSLTFRREFLIVTVKEVPIYVFEFLEGG